MNFMLSLLVKCLKILAQSWVILFLLRYKIKHHNIKLFYVFTNENHLLIKENLIKIILDIKK